MQNAVEVPSVVLVSHYSVQEQLTRISAAIPGLEELLSSLAESDPRTEAVLTTLISAQQAEEWLSEFADV